MNSRFLQAALVSFSLSAVSLAAADWPHWMGPTRDGRLSANTPVPAKLPDNMKPLWRINVGGGFASPVTEGGRLVYVDENGTDEIVHVVDTKTGKELWSKAYSPRFEDEWGAGPRATPLIDGDRLYVQSCVGNFRCMGLTNGAVIWSTSFEKDFGVKFLGSKVNEGTATRRGNNGSPVIDEDSIFVPVGSTDGASIVRFDKKTGKVIWKSGKDEAAYAALQIATIAGVRQVVAFTAEALTGLDAATGTELWRVPLKTAAKRHAGTPLIFENKVIVNSHTFGLTCFNITKSDKGMEAIQVWNNKNAKINLASPVWVGSFLYSHGPGTDFICVDAATGETKWSQTGFGRDIKKAWSATVVAGKNLLVLSQDGTLTMLAADPAEYKQLGRQQICGRTWSYPAVADGKLIVRDTRELICYDLMPTSPANSTAAK